MPVADQEYLAWCKEYPLHEIYDLEDCTAATAMLRRCQRPANELTDGQRLYIAGLKLFITQFNKDMGQYLAENRVPDDVVLRYLIVGSGGETTPEALQRLSQQINYPDVNLQAVLDGKETLCRDGVARVTTHFRVSANIFDHSVKVGYRSTNWRFRINGSPGFYRLRDTTTHEEVDFGHCKEAVGDLNGDTFVLCPYGLGFVEEVELQLNMAESEEDVLNVYFPSYRAAKKAEDTAIRTLNALRHMFYILSGPGFSEDLFIADAGDTRTHEEWASSICLNNWSMPVRGAYYPTAKRLLFYTGVDHRTDATVAKAAHKWLTRLVKRLDIPADTQIGLGVTVGKPGTVWEPMEAIGTVGSVMAAQESGSNQLAGAK
jgi:hypothetical protein